MSTYWLAVIVTALVAVGARAAWWCSHPDNARIADLWLHRDRRRLLHEQELRDIDLWLEQMWQDRRRR